MAILFDTAGKELHRTAGTFLSTGSNFTVALWIKRVTDTPSGVNYRTYYELDRGLATGYIFLGSNGGTDQIQLYVSNGIGADQSFNGPSLAINTWYFAVLTYNATSHVFSLYLGTDAASLVLVNTLTQDMSTITFTDQTLGDDGSSSWSKLAVEYFRDWQRILTLTEMKAELAAFTAVSATNLFTDTPLVATGVLTDLSGNAHTWVAVGAISTTFPGPLAPTNTDSTTALDVGPLDSVLTLNVQDAGTNHTVWFKYTAKVNDVEIGIWAVAPLASNYNPQVTVWVGSPPGVTNNYPAASGVGSQVPMEFAVAAGTTYYFRVIDSAAVDPLDSVLTFYTTLSPHTDPADGDLLIPIDGYGPTFPGVLTTLVALSFTTGAIHSFKYFPAGEQGTSLPARNRIFFKPYDDLTGCRVYRYDAPTKEFVFVAEVPLGNDVPDANGGPILTSNGKDAFYFIQCLPNPGNPATVAKVSLNGAVGQTWTLPVNSGSLQAACPSPDDTILYYAVNSGGVNPDVIHRFDLVHSVALADLVGAVATYTIHKDLIVLQDGTILAAYTKAGFSQIIRYSAAGAVLNTYAFTQPHLDRFCRAVDDPTSFVVWLQNAAVTLSTFQNLRVTDGVALQSFPDPIFIRNGPYAGATSDTPPRFGTTGSCPIMLLGVPTIPPPTVIRATLLCDLRTLGG